jgi:hypothetical protein
MPYKEVNGCKVYSYLTAAESMLIGRKLKKSAGILTTPADLKRKGVSQSLPTRQVQQEDSTNQSSEHGQTDPQTKAKK